jgi:hypothetical protein
VNSISDPGAIHVANMDPGQDEFDVRLIAFYLPQFHPTKENDEWWGAGFTEWRSVTKATPLFKGHYQPRLPGDLGFYDLRLNEVRHAQIDLARQAGLHGFCFYYYWFNGRRILQMPLDAYVADAKIDFPFCICWANENWSRLWDGGNREVLLVQEHEFESDMQFIRDVIPLLKDPRYIRVNEKPLLLLYREDLMKTAQATVAGWRRECQQAGLPDIYVCCVQSFKMTDPNEFGFDAACEFPPHQYKCGVITSEVEDLEEDFKGTIYDYEMVARQSLTRPVPKYTLMRGIFPSWDNSARKRQQALIFHNSGPKPYEYWLRGLIQYSRQNLPEDERIIFINAWNEWAEGAHLEPDLRYGRSYIDATRRALAGRTDPNVLFDLIQSRVETIRAPKLREELQAYVVEARNELQAVNTTVRYFQTEKLISERLAFERSAAGFLPFQVFTIFGDTPGADMSFNLEYINGRSFRSGQLVDGHVTIYLGGWFLSNGMIPDAQTTNRYMLLRHEETGKTYMAQVQGTLERNDVVAHLSAIEKKYSQRCGFQQLFSLSNLPGGTYTIGFGMKSNNKSVMAWSKSLIRFVV